MEGTAGADGTDVASTGGGGWMGQNVQRDPTTTWTGTTKETCRNEKRHNNNASIIMLILKNNYIILRKSIQHIQILFIQ